MVRTFRQSALICAGAAIAALAMVQSASAQANCAIYGKLALQQNKENVARKCGFSGPSWSDNLQAHIAWCGTVGPAQWKTELQRRAAMLKNECK